MSEDLQTTFLKKLEGHFAEFNRKMEQNKLFQLQERLSESIIKQIDSQVEIAKNIAQLTVYKNNAAALQATGKTYKNVLEEKIYIDGYRIFEEFIASIFTSIFSVFPNLLLDGNKEQLLSIPFDYIFTNPDIERSRALVIENRVKTYLQGDNISKILERFKSTFHLKISLSDIQKQDCQRVALLRNVIMHNNSKINEIYLNSIAIFKIPNNTYQLNEQIQPHLENEINFQRHILGTLSKQLVEDLESQNNLKTLNERHKNLGS